jgi:hypothetical protein
MSSRSRERGKNGSWMISIVPFKKSFIGANRCCQFETLKISHLHNCVVFPSEIVHLLFAESGYPILD